MTDVTSTEEKYEQRRKEEREQTIASVLAAPMQVDDSTFTVEFALPAPLKLTTTHPPLEITRVRVSSTRSFRPQAGNDDHDDAPYVRASGYGRSLNTKGEPDGREQATWRHLPNELAAPLLGRALTE